MYSLLEFLLTVAILGVPIVLARIVDKQIGASIEEKQVFSTKVIIITICHGPSY